MIAERRCKCHPAAYYATCVRCPRCHHWSYDPWAESCERRRCAYVGPVPTEPVQDTLGLVR